MTGKRLEEMTLREKIGQLLVTGFKGIEIPEEYKELVRNYKISNTIFFSYNVRNEKQLKELSASVQRLVWEETGNCAFITIDEEGGVVTRLPEESFHMPGAMAIAQGSVKHAYQAALYTGEKLKELAIHFNLAPVLDVNSNPDNPVIGVRSFGKDAGIVAEYGCAMVKGYLDAGIMCSVKHFPGHGDTAVDSHLSLPCVDKSYEELRKVELIPFREAVKAGTTAVTLAHILFPQIEKEKVPATMSAHIIQNLLRKDLGFTGLVISDCMEMNAIKEYYGTAKGALMAIKAGVDLVFISHTAETAREAVLVIEKAVAEGELPEERINEAVARVLFYKEKYGVLPNSKRTEEENAKRNGFEDILMQQAVKFTNRDKNYHFVLGKTPLFIGCGAYRSTLASSNVDEGLHFASYFGKKYQADYVNYSVQPKEEEIKEIVRSVGQKHYSSIAVATYNGHLNAGQIQLVSKLQEQEIPMVMIALRNPYDLDRIDDSVDKIAGYEYTEKAFRAIERLFRMV